MKTTENTTNLDVDDVSEAAEPAKPAARQKRKVKQDQRPKNGSAGEGGRNVLPVTQFDFRGRTVGSVMKDGQPWFIAKDVCDVLEHSNSRMAVSGLDGDEKGISIVDTPGGAQEVGVVSESGLYNLVFTSRKPQAKAFRRWVTNEVLPAIRQTGRYEAAPASGPRGVQIDLPPLGPPLSRSWSRPQVPRSDLTCGQERHHLDLCRRTV